MSRIGGLLRAILSGGPRCPWCGVPSPHRMPHPMSCPWYPFNPAISPASYRARLTSEKGQPAVSHEASPKASRANSGGGR